MAYIWEKYNEENYYYMPEGRQSYYEEVWGRRGKDIPVNIFNRFTEIFYPMNLNCDPVMIKEAEERYKNDDKFRDICNLIIHQLALWDRLKGITLEDIEMSLIYDDMKEGRYGDKIKNAIETLEFDDLYIILKELAKSSRQKNTVVLLDEVLHLLFGKVIIYKENSTGKTMIYIEQEKNEYREKVYETAVFLFADMELEMESFWANEHFGLIGNASTMKIGKINIY